MGNQPSNHTQMGPQGHPWWQNRESRPPLCVAPYGKLERLSNAGLARSTGFRTQRANPCLPPVHLCSRSSWSPHGRCWDVCPAEHGPCAMLAREVGSGSQHACADTELRNSLPASDLSIWQLSQCWEPRQSLPASWLSQVTQQKEVKQGRVAFVSWLLPGSSPTTVGNSWHQNHCICSQEAERGGYLCLA